MLYWMLIGACNPNVMPDARPQAVAAQLRADHSPQGPLVVDRTFKVLILNLGLILTFHPHLGPGAILSHTRRGDMLFSLCPCLPPADSGLQSADTDSRRQDLGAAANSVFGMLYGNFDIILHHSREFF